MAALFDPLLIAIVAPLAVALAIGCGLPKRWSVRLAYVGFGIPLLMALHVWWHYSAQTPVSGYAFLRQYSTGLDGLGVSLKLGLNGVALPLFVMAGIVGFAAGLYEPFGVVAPAEDEILVIQRPEITRLRDRDGDGVADEFHTVADDWGITGSYHEFSYGLARDRAGNLYASSGLCSFGRGVDLPWVRGPLQTAQYLPWSGPGAVPDGHRSVALYQGWAFRVSPEGRFETFASGFRQPLGVGISPDDELFISDCAGAWVPTSTFTHVERGGFYGHADSLKWHPEFKDRHLRNVGLPKA